MKRNTDEEIEATIHSLDGINRAEPSYYFKAKLMARLEARRADSNSLIFQILLQPRVALGMLSVFVALNIGAITFLLQEPTSSGSNNGIQTFAQEYNLETNTLYEPITVE